MSWHRKKQGQDPMPELQTDGPAGPNVKANKPENSFSSKAARYGGIAPTICWLFLVLDIVLNWDLYGIAWILEILFLIAFSSFCAGLVALGAPKKLDVFAGILGILLSGSFGFYDLLGLTVRV